MSTPTPGPTPTPTPIWYQPGPTHTPIATLTGAWSGGSFSGGGNQPGGGSGGGSSGFGNDWPTYTPFPTSDATAQFSLALPPELLPSHIVQGYNTLNQNNAFDMVWFVVIVFSMVGGVMSIYRRLQGT